MKPANTQAVADGVAKLIHVYHEMEDLTGSILGTLTLNKHSFFRDDEPAQHVFNELVARWRQRYQQLLS